MTDAHTAPRTGPALPASMRAVVVDAFGEPPVLREVPVPACPTDGVVVRVEATGLCRSDWHAWQGHDDGVTVPFVPGHELAGTVVATGAGVGRWQAGDRVTVPFVCACGRCAACEAGEQQVCEGQEQPGFTQDGSWAEYVALRYADVNLVRLPEGMSAVTAASLGCRFATAYRALTVHGRVRAGDVVAVHGCGGVGLSAVMVAAAAGARVVAVDVADGALEAARRMGATAVVRVAPGDTPEEVAAAVVTAAGRVSGGDGAGGAHLSVDALGSPATATASVLSLRRRGRHLQVGLLLGEYARAGLPMDRVVAWELEVYGSHGMAAHEYPAMLADVAAGRLRPEALVGRVVGLEDVPSAVAGSGGGAGAGRGAGITVAVPGGG